MKAKCAYIAERERRLFRVSSWYLGSCVLYYIENEILFQYKKLFLNICESRRAAASECCLYRRQHFSTGCAVWIFTFAEIQYFSMSVGHGNEG